ncbi:MAG: hypothetical protein D6690_02140 [Nitrospirae bacterium]|nr:MAG: hypothetical protein D6690_02140 [Nitrospirota bacterium]
MFRHRMQHASDNGSCIHDHQHALANLFRLFVGPNRLQKRKRVALVRGFTLSHNSRRFVEGKSSRTGPAIVLTGLLMIGIASSPGIAQESSEPSTTTPSQMASDVNIRLSSKALIPPDELIVHRVPLHGLTVAQPFVGPPMYSAILEDDHRHRLAILTADAHGQLTAYLLEDIALASSLPEIGRCAQHRQCATDRMPATGGIACIAICFREALMAEYLP